MYTGHRAADLTGGLRTQTRLKLISLNLNGLLIAWAQLGFIVQTQIFLVCLLRLVARKIRINETLVNCSTCVV